MLHLHAKGGRRKWGIRWPCITTSSTPIRHVDYWGIPPPLFRPLLGAAVSEPLVGEPLLWPGAPEECPGEPLPLVSVPGVTVVVPLGAPLVSMPLLSLPEVPAPEVSGVTVFSFSPAPVPLLPV